MTPVDYKKVNGGPEYQHPNLGAGAGCRDGRILDTFWQNVTIIVTKMYPKSVQTQNVSKLYVDTLSKSANCLQKVSILQE